MRKSETVDPHIPPMNHDNRIVPSVQTDTTSSRSSLPTLTVFPRFHHHLNLNYRWQFARPSTSTSHISSRYPEILGSNLSLDFPGPGPAARIKRVQLELEFELEVKELHLSVNLGMQYLVYLQYRGKGINIG